MMLASPYFVIPWFVTGISFAIWAAYDMYRVNTPVNAPLKPGWIIILIFFSIPGLILYLETARPKGIGHVPDAEEKADLFKAYAEPSWRKTVAAAIHCVAGDGLGIFTAMVFARIWNLSFWHEFWLEYAVGFLFGWFIFQFWSMREMGHGWKTALWKAGRAEFFSMFTVMFGMGLVMGSVTPAVLGHPPDPWEAAFWGFGALGLAVGFLFTIPMNYWLIQRGYKHGMG